MTTACAGRLTPHANVEIQHKTYDKYCGRNVHTLLSHQPRQRDSKIARHLTFLLSIVIFPSSSRLVLHATISTIPPTSSLAVTPIDLEKDDQQSIRETGPSWNE
ncbi:uncharacterized protein IAS62_006045 [Cryptococcus decagattii]|uniref:Uncharacterized protein n=1 Tax=Cryptococcus decagattii TaxID=1859122 RepID=A0ABZ2B7B9_9TREE